jgi:hypothetical protein
MTAIMMGTMGAAAVTVAALETTVTVVEMDWFTAGTEGDYFAWGYNDANADPNNLATAGSIADGTYTDGSTTVRTVASVYYTENTGGLADPDDAIYFGLVGTSIPNTDTTFVEIEYNGIVYTRASATAYLSSVGGQTTFWYWKDVSPNGPTSGVRDFKVVI